jgi:hypothetical protein
VRVVTLGGGALAAGMLVAALAWRAVGPEVARPPSSPSGGTAARGEGAGEAASDGTGQRLPPLEKTRDPGSIDEPEPGWVRWSLTFPSGVWSLRFRAGGTVVLGFEDFSGSISPDCAELVAVTPRGPAPLPAGSFSDAPRRVTLDDVPLEVVQALATAPELALVACERHFVLDGPQRASLRAFYLRAAERVLDALTASAGSDVARVPPPDRGQER